MLPGKPSIGCVPAFSNAVTICHEYRIAIEVERDSQTSQFMTGDAEDTVI